MSRTLGSAPGPAAAAAWLRRVTYRITVIGTGYLGATHAAGMAELGHDVLGLDIDAKIEAPVGRRRAVLRARAARAPVSAGSTAGGCGSPTDPPRWPRSATSTSCASAPRSGPAGRRRPDAMGRAADALAPHLGRPTLVVGKSTVPVGTAPMARRRLRRWPRRRRVEVAWNPEFLREGPR